MLKYISQIRPTYQVRQVSQKTWFGRGLDFDCHILTAGKLSRT